MLVGNVAKHALERPELWVVAVDGAGENIGLGNAEQTREHPCGEHSPFDLIWLSQKAWPGVIRGLEKAGLREELDIFFGNKGFEWPGLQGRQNRVRRIQSFWRRRVTPVPPPQPPPLMTATSE